MTISKKEHQDIINFIKAYRAMETGSLSDNLKLITSIVDSDKAKHLCESWSGRENDFGSFYLNLSHNTQAKFLLQWNIQLTGYDEYLTELESHSAAHVFATPPVEVSKIHHLLLFFNNYSVEDTTGIKLPINAANRYGNSANWGKYILSLDREYQYSVLLQIMDYNAESMVEAQENRRFMCQVIMGTNG
jgi:hypothetical protein